jgi:hypothetical protein
MRTVAATVVVILAVLIQLAASKAMPAPPDIALAALLAVSGGIGFLPHLALVALAVLILNGQPGPSPDMAVFVILPLLGLFAAHRLPFQPWLSGFVVVASGCALFPLILAPETVASDPVRFARLWGVGLVIGLLVASALDGAGTKETP